MGSHNEDRLRLDLIEEEEKIDEFLQETQNFWNQDVERNEQNYDR